MNLRSCAMTGLLSILAACSTQLKQTQLNQHRYPCHYQALNKGGSFYKDDGPDTYMPVNMNSTPEPMPILEPLHRFANRPYTIFGKDYVPHTQLINFTQQGMGSWYGRKFHGQKTSSGELYNMYTMSAAHPTLPIPSYARVTNQKNGRTIVVRINDRGPFHKDRVIDLSFLAACRLGYAMDGSSELKVEAILPDQRIARLTNPRLAMDVTKVYFTPSMIAPSGTVFIQLGAFTSLDNAKIFRNKVAAIFKQSTEHIYLHSIDNLVRVRIGPFKEQHIAFKIAERLITDHNINAVLTH